LVCVLVVSSLLASASPLWTQLKWQLVEQNELTPGVFDPAYRLLTFCTREDWTWHLETHVHEHALATSLLAHRLHGLSAQTDYGILHTQIQV